MTGEESPTAVYAERLAHWHGEGEGLARVASLFSNARLAVFLVLVVLAWFTLGVRTLHPGWLAPAALGFVALVVGHDRVLRRKEHAERAARYYAAGLARIADPLDPAGSGPDGAGFLDAEHPYAPDLDLFGPASLFALLCRARSRAGRETLAAWLCEPADPETLRERQRAVAELARDLDFRESLALIDVGGDDAETAFAVDRFVAFCKAPAIGPTRFLRIFGALLSLASVLALAGGAVAFGTGALGFASPLLAAQAIFFAWLGGRRRAVLSSVEKATGDLSPLAKLVERLEDARFESPLLVALRDRIETGGVPASRQLARLRRAIDLCDARRNQMYWVPPIGPLLGLVTQAALSIEAWRARAGADAADWIRVIGELEALSCLATQAYEHPADRFPEIVERGAVFEAEGLGHPLLAEEASIRNGVHLCAGEGEAGNEPAVLVVSGSNMSGKSTLLRSVGTNAVLALAGGPVRATRLRISPLHVGASIRVQDSLREGASRFYAEIRRIAQVVEATEGEQPVLFLLDEIFHGTNSHDRRIGAEAIVRRLVAQNAIGLVTTHDLALAKLADGLAPRVRNVHFEDQLVEGRIHFDYQMREGVITRSNALALMRAVGLDVPDA